MDFPVKVNLMDIGRLRGLLLLFLMVLGCKKDHSSTIPLVNVNIAIYTTDPQFLNLTTVSGWEYVTGGSRGIVVYRRSSTEFMAYDRHCTYLPDDDCGRVVVDSTNILLTDTCCGSRFVLVDGSVAEAPAKVPLKQYQTSFDGSILRIFN